MRLLWTGFSAVIVAVMLAVSTHSQELKPCLNCETVNRKTSPKYRVARRIKSTTGGLTVYVSIHKDQFTKAGLTALACRLTQDFANKDLLVQIFDNFDSAKKYVTPWQQEKPAHWKEYERSLRATYLRDASKNQHWIIWDVDAQKTREEKVDICPLGVKDEVRHRSVQGPECWAFFAGSRDTTHEGGGPTQ